MGHKQIAMKRNEGKRSVESKMYESGVKHAEKTTVKRI